MDPSAPVAVIQSLRTGGKRMAFDWICASFQRDPEPDRQADALQAFNLDRIFEDKASGKNADRPGLQQMLDFLREGDTLYVESVSRIARSTRDLLAIVERLESKHIGFVSLKESINTASPQGRFILVIFSALSELERETIHQRQREGIEAARARGVQRADPKRNAPPSGIRSSVNGERAESRLLLRCGR